MSDVNELRRNCLNIIGQYKEHPIYALDDECKAGRLPDEWKEQEYSLIFTIAENNARIAELDAEVERLRVNNAKLANAVADLTQQHTDTLLALDRCRDAKETNDE